MRDPGSIAIASSVERRRMIEREGTTGLATAITSPTVCPEIGRILHELRHACLRLELSATELARGGGRTRNEASPRHFRNERASVAVMVGWQSGFTDTRIQPDRDVSVTRPYLDTNQAPMYSLGLEMAVVVGRVGIRSRRTSFGRMSSSNAFDVAASPPTSEDDPRGTPRQSWLVGEPGRGDVRDKFETDPAVRTATIRCSRARSTDFGVANT